MARHDMDEEVEQHLQDRYAELLTAGVPPDEATRLVREEIRGWTPRVPGDALASLAGDLRYACRSLGKHPGFAIVVIQSSR